MVRSFLLVCALCICLIVVALSPAMYQHALGSVDAGDVGPEVVSNLERLGRSGRLAADSLLERYHRGDTLCLYVADHASAWLVEQSLLASADSMGLTLRGCDASPPDRISIAVTSIGIVYADTGDNDSTERRATLNLSASFPERSSAIGSHDPGSRKLARSFAVELVDTIPAEMEPAFDASGYEFARGIRIAKSSPGFWEKIVEPAVILGASALMVILLFTVRSQ